MRIIKDFDASDYVLWRNMYFDRETGEAVVENANAVIDGRQQSVYLSTDWYFLETTQQHPNMATQAEPWGFLADQSVQRMLGLLALYLPVGAEIVGVTDREANVIFPYSRLTKSIDVKYKGKVYPTPAASIAAECARQTSYDNVTHKLRQPVQMVFDHVIAEMTKPAEE